MSGAFSRLPLEVLVMILQHIRDLPSIYKFVCASAQANAAFEITPDRIVENAIESSIPDFKHLARMIVILGSFSPSQPTFEELVDKCKRRLQHICFIALLENIHELIWYSPAPVDGGKQSDRHYTVKQSRVGVYFQAVAWWSPSWVEKMRIVRVFWKLIIYWNIRTICKDTGYNFRQYSAKIKHMVPNIGPDMKSDSERVGYQHEFEEIKCVLAATQELLGCADEFFEIFTAFTAHDYPKFQIKKGPSSTLLKETAHWKFENPKPVARNSSALYHGQIKRCASDMNSAYRCFYWLAWIAPHSSLDCCNLQIPDYLGCASGT